MSWSYNGIKQRIKENGGRLADYIVLAAKNDPFYMGRPAQVERAKWFADIWQKYGYDTGVHLRRIHYRIQGESPPIKTPDGQTYENDNRSWGYLGEASLCARYLGYVDPAHFVDRRTGLPTINYKPEGESIAVWTDCQDVDLDISLPPLPDIPNYSLYLNVDQPYQIEIWTEKSTMDDIIIPLCEKYRINHVPGVGEISLTNAELIVQRAITNQKPCRIFYVSDFDPAGQSMPVAAARKIEYLMQQYGCDVDVMLIPAVLTKQQCEEYRLPRKPIVKDKARGQKFDEKHGGGATELDALEGRHPGELKKVLEKMILQYYDKDLDEVLFDKQTDIQAGLTKTRRAVVEKYSEEYDELVKEYQKLKEMTEWRLEKVQGDINDLYGRIADDLENNMPQYSAEELPSPTMAEENGKPLFSSGRPYLEQLQAYKQFQNSGSTD